MDITDTIIQQINFQPIKICESSYQPDLTLMHMTLPDHLSFLWILSEKLVDAYKYLDDMSDCCDELKC